jgi:Ca-activated chloride channel homolog
VNRRVLAAVACAPFVFGFGVLESRNADVEKGNGAMKAGKAEEALAHYDKAVAKLPADPGAHFDRGAALYALSRFDEAGQEFLRATQAPDTALKANAFLNLGNAFFKKEKWKEAIEAYKRTLALRPEDQSAKWNLEIALAKRKEEEKKKQDDKDKDKDKDDKKDENKKDENKKDDEKKDDKKNDQNKEQNKDDKKEQPQNDKDASKPPPPKPAGQEPPPQQIEAVLDNLERSSKDLEKERARLRAVRRRPPVKDW